MKKFNTFFSYVAYKNLISTILQIFSHLPDILKNI